MDNGPCPPQASPNPALIFTSIRRAWSPFQKGDLGRFRAGCLPWYASAKGIHERREDAFCAFFNLCAKPHSFGKIGFTLNF